MERWFVLLVVATELLIFASILTQPSCAVEHKYHWCGRYGNTCYGFCDPGRCCSMSGYCNDQKTGKCCADNKGGYDADCLWCSHSTSNIQVGASLNQTLGGLMFKHGLLNASYTGYLDRSDDLTRATSSTSSQLSSFSCAASLDLMSTALHHRHPWAAFPSPFATPKNITSTCGHCLKVTKLGAVGGIHRQVKLIIVHEHNNSGIIEMDSNTIRQLNSDDKENTEGLFVVKYEFESC